MKSLTIVVAPVNAVGHVNACSGALGPLLRRGHRVIFVVEEAFKGKLVALGFEEFIYHVKKGDDSQKPGETISKMLLKMKMLGNYSAWEKMENMLPAFHCDEIYDEITTMDRKLREAITKFKPDLFYFDGGLLYPSIYHSGIPWVKNVSVQPLLFLVDETNEIPPGASGLPCDGDREKFIEFNKMRKEMLFSTKYGDLIQKLGYERFPKDSVWPKTKTLTVYGYPNELDYPFVQKLGWFNLEVFNKADDTKAVKLDELVPKEFLNDTLDGQFSGKLIYLSMGSMGSIDVDLMNRFGSILGQTKHKYIVSKGHRHGEYELPRNMWGERYLPQTKIVPHVDLVITHGGNNTTTEVFAEGKPMIVMPLFSDQFDNAQRVHEKRYGIRLNPYQFTEKEILDAIDKLLDDQELHRKLQKASQRIQSENRHELLADKIEALVVKT